MNGHCTGYQHITTSTFLKVGPFTGSAPRSQGVDEESVAALEVVIAGGEQAGAVIASNFCSS